MRVVGQVTDRIWVIDGNNVMGAGADGWWNDPTTAAVRTAQAVAVWCRTHEHQVTMVFDGKREARLTEVAGGNLTIAFATRSGRDAADDRIVEIVDERYHDDLDLTVVTSDKGLIERLPPGVIVEGAGQFRHRIGLPSGGRNR